MAEIAVRILCETWSDALPDPEAMAARAANAALASGALKDAMDGELSIVFADAAFIQDLNRDFRGQDKPTNVLAFPAQDAQVPAPRLMGDIVLAIEPVRHEADAQGKQIADHASHLIVHGILHLMGFDHDTDQKAQVMEAAEVSILSALGVSDPYQLPEAQVSAAPAHG